MRPIKNLFWNLIALIGSRCIGLLRRRSIKFGSSEWRVAEFSFSQLGEDRVLCHLFESLGIRNGLYVDVGAFHPARYSNTFLLWKSGWQGVNIDANPEVIRLFEKQRPKDHNICAAISDIEGEAIYLRYPEEATNRVIMEETNEMQSVLGEKPIQTTKILTRTLNSILSECGDIGRMDLLTIDCEGQDLKVLRGLDFSRWRPKVIMVEAHHDLDREHLAHLLGPLGYKLVARLLITDIYQAITL